MSIILALTLSSCTPGTKYLLFNNTGEEIEILLVGETYKLQSHEWLDLNWPRNPLLIVRTGERTFNYAVSFSYSGRVSVSGVEVVLPVGGCSLSLLYVTFCLQIERDGSVYVVPRGESFPASVPRPQPQGFPVHPIERAT